MELKLGIIKRWFKFSKCQNAEMASHWDLES